MMIYLDPSAPPRDLVLSGCRDSESLTPAKLAVSLLIRDYSYVTRSQDKEETMTSRQRKKFALLALKLTQVRSKILHPVKSIILKYMSLIVLMIFF